MDQVGSTQTQETSTQYGSTTPSTVRQEDTASSTPVILFREIHKNAWLKKLPSSENKKLGAFPKVPKGERVWAVFCIHDDVEALVELYQDQKQASTHKPDWFVSLRNCLHVSPTICAQEDEYEFVITLSSDVIRLAAPSWDLMMEWVDTIRNKLREMKILSPKENIYSKTPEPRLPLAPTRDPNSPLPAPPVGPSVVVPGVEPLRPETSDGSSTVSGDAVPSSSISPPGENAQAQLVNFRLTPGSDSQSSSSSTPASALNPERLAYNRVRPQQFPNITVPSAASHSLQTPSSSSSSASSSGSQSGSSAENVTIVEVRDNGEENSQSQVFNFEFMARTLNNTERENNSLPPARPLLECRYHQAATSAFLDPFTSNYAQSGHSTSLNGTNPISAADLEEGSPYECVFINPLQQSPVPAANPTAQGVTRHQESAPEGRRRQRTTSGSELSNSSRTERSQAAMARNRTPPRVHSEQRLLPAPHPYRQPPPASNVNSILSDAGHRLTLREQQVRQLRREMMHPGGVRMQLRRKDCIGSIALVDTFGVVWIAGWKQREHPLLYNAFHIGDQLLSVGNIVVQSAGDAQKLIRGSTSLYVEFVIRRVPFGHVYAIQRDVEGQDLGIVLEGNTAEIKDVLPGSVAARHGLTPRAPTCDGLSLCNWLMTEINGRPLNLFFKDGEVKDRLNAVGRDISILVQPFDLMKSIRKQLKSLRGYKEYIVQ